jgi:hypothetical protein
MNTDKRIDHAKSIGAFLAQLRQADVIPQPEGEDWSARATRIGIPGRIAEVDEETYWYFLEVLPPRYQRGNTFAFTEGWAPFLLFWQHGDGYYCRQLTWDETKIFCGLAKASRHS